MHPIHDVDVITLLAILLAAKRRPAALQEIIAAAVIIQGPQGTLPSVAKLKSAFARLAETGLIEQVASTADDSTPLEPTFSLTATAEQAVAGGARNATTSERLFALKQKLVAYTPAAASPAIALSEEQLHAAIAAQLVASAGISQNLLMPKPKTTDDERKKTTGPGVRQRKPMPAKKRKG